MRWQLLAVVLLLVLGVGAAGVAIFGAGLANGADSDYLTATATRTDVVDQAVADGTIAPAAIYGLAFGSDPYIVDDAASSPGGGTWLVDQVNVQVGQEVKAGDALATADTTDAAAALALAQAQLDAAQARYDSDSGGVSATDEQSAQLSVDQAEQQLASAKQSRDETIRENAIRIGQAEGDVADARSQLADDRDTDAPDSVIEADKQALTQAKESLRLLRVQVDAQNRQARDQVESAQLALKAAQNSYDSHTEPTSDETLASDRASLLQAQQALADAQADLDGATLRSPLDGVVVAQELVPGTVAPSGAAIQVMSRDMQVNAEFAESDLPNLEADQTALVTVSATGDELTGSVSGINPVASTSGNSSVVSYSVTIDLATVPAGVLPGMSASVAVTIAESNDVIAVPSTALQGAAGSYAVQVVGADGQASVRQVEVGLVTSSLAEIKSGLAEGEEVVIGTTSALNGSNGGGFFFPGGGPPRTVQGGGGGSVQVTNP